MIGVIPISVAHRGQEASRALRVLGDALPAVFDPSYPQLEAKGVLRMATLWLCRLGVNFIENSEYVVSIDHC